jgi:hypothetical protein
MFRPRRREQRDAMEKLEADRAKADKIERDRVEDGPF